MTEPWSSGQAEGQINRLKLIKRQSYGRAGLDPAAPHDPRKVSKSHQAGAISVFVFGMAAYNLVRLPKLLQARGEVCLDGAK